MSDPGPIPDRLRTSAVKNVLGVVSVLILVVGATAIIIKHPKMFGAPGSSPAVLSSQVAPRYIDFLKNAQITDMHVLCLPADGAGQGAIGAAVWKKGSNEPEILRSAMGCTTFQLILHADLSRGQAWVYLDDDDVESEGNKEAYTLENVTHILDGLTTQYKNRPVESV